MDPTQPFQEGLPASLLQSNQTTPEPGKPPSVELGSDGLPYPPGTPWYAILIDRRVHKFKDSAFFFASGLIAIAPELYEMLPSFQADMPVSLFHHITSAVGALMVLSKIWGMYKNFAKTERRNMKIALNYIAFVLATLVIICSGGCATAPGTTPKAIDLTQLSAAKFGHADLQNAAGLADKAGAPARAGVWRAKDALFIAIEQQASACLNAIAASAPVTTAAGGTVGAATIVELADASGRATRDRVNRNGVQGHSVSTNVLHIEENGRASFRCPACSIPHTVSVNPGGWGIQWRSR